MKSKFWVTIAVSLVALPVGFYTAFVAECFWNWFAVPVIHVSEVSFLQMLGLLWLAKMLTGELWTGEDKRWEMLASVVELCVPEERKEALDNLVKEGSFAAFPLVFGQLVGNTLMLALGFVLHFFTS